MQYAGLVMKKKKLRYIWGIRIHMQKVNLNFNAIET